MVTMRVFAGNKGPVRLTLDEGGGVTVPAGRDATLSVSAGFVHRNRPRVYAAGGSVGVEEWDEADEPEGGGEVDMPAAADGWQDNYRAAQAAAQHLDIPANQSHDDLRAAIREALE